MLRTVLQDLGHHGGEEFLVSTDRAERALRLFEKCLQIAEAKRRAFLDSACSDDSELRKEVERLLDLHPRAEDPLRSRTAVGGIKAVFDESFGLDEKRSDPSPASAAVGTVLGDYELLEEISRGGMGVVYKARQKSLNRLVALKMILAAEFASVEVVERFRREASAAARIRHSNVVPVYEVGKVGEHHFYTMEYIDGPSLDELIARSREESEKKAKGTSTTPDPESIKRAVEQFALLADGLEEAHREGLIHRDVKPANILVDRDGRYRLADFGLGREVTAETITRTGALIGTLGYMSPEQVARRQVDSRSDVYSLAVALYEFLTLKRPFSDVSEHEIANAILFDDPPSPRRLNPRLDRDLEIAHLGSSGTRRRERTKSISSSRRPGPADTRTCPTST